MPLKKKKKKKIGAKKVVKKRAAKKKKRLVRKPVKKVLKPKKVQENIIGVVTHYFPKVSAAVVKLKAPLTIGDAIKIKGHTTDFKQTVTSLQINHVPINSAKKGQEIGLLVTSRARQHDIVYKV